VAFTRRGRYSSKNLADSIWSSRPAALKAAVAWRDQQRLRLRQPMRVRRRTPPQQDGLRGRDGGAPPVGGRLHLPVVPSELVGAGVLS